VSNHIFKKKLLVICVVAASVTSGTLYAEWPNNQPERFNAPKIGDFPPENIDELLKQGNPDFSQQAGAGTVVAQPPRQSMQQQPVQLPMHRAAQTGAPVQQPVQQAVQQAPQYAAQQQGYGAYPSSGQGWNRGYDNRSWSNRPRSNGPWDNRGSNFSMPWGNNRSGFSGPWNGSWGGSNWDNRRNYGAPWNNRGSSFSMPWGSNNSGFTPFNR